MLERCSDDQCLVLAKFLHVNKHIHGSAAVTPSEPTSSHPSSIASNAPSPFVTRPSPLGQTPHGPSPGSWGAASGPTPPAQAGGEHTAERRRVERAPRGAHGAQGLTPSCSEKVGRIGGGDATTGATAGVGLFFVQAQGGFGACEVDEVIPGSSADEQGSIRVGDVLTAVDSRDIRGLSLAQVRDAIVGQPGSLVTLTLNRPAPRHILSHTRPRGAPTISADPRRRPRCLGRRTVRPREHRGCLSQGGWQHFCRATRACSRRRCRAHTSRRQLGPSRRKCPTGEGFGEGPKGPAYGGALSSRRRWRDARIGWGWAGRG